ncbi:DUF6455 family protein [Phaeovulum sp. NW3]|uniref:DUF6455 family protein n=1 Tax=Phaeovulum sp. NW3 TaxID=2934933 RepID=UPI0020225EC4|nr:DUF6455 family protein [Phaeovulum sp. NW3]MCL7466149.1 DUF6455 family protein [Phaeovulum sp. NW3]
MFERIKKWQEKTRDLAEIRMISDVDLNDMGVSRNELRSIVGFGAEVDTRQMAMAERHGLDSYCLRRHPQDLIASNKACAECGHVEECASYLASDVPAEASARFCPNYELYQQLAE